MARSRKRHTHLELLESITEWSTRHGLKEDPYVEKLSKVLSENRRYTHLASISAVEHLPYPRIISKNSNFLFWLILIRNILIFLPVGLTWFAISQAAIAFNVFAMSNPELIVNFLTFWQDGYGVLDPKWKLSRVAILDASIMLVVVILVFITTLLSKSNNSTALQMRQRNESERKSLGLRIDEFLDTKKFISNLSISGEVSRMIHSLRFASESLDSSSTSLNKAVKEFVKKEQKAKSLNLEKYSK